MHDIRGPTAQTAAEYFINPNETVCVYFVLERRPLCRFRIWFVSLNRKIKHSIAARCCDDADGDRFQFE